MTATQEVEVDADPAGGHGELIAAARRARCRHCGRTTVVAVCSSCHNLLCGRHDRKADLADPWRSTTAPPRDGPKRAAREEGAAGHRKAERAEPPQQDEAPGSEPESPPESPPRPESPPKPEKPARSTGPVVAPRAQPPRKMDPKRVMERHYCPECLPQGRPHDVVVQVAAAEVALGGVASVWSPWIGGLLVAVGAARAGWRIVRSRRRRSPSPVRPLFLDPRFTKVELTETLTGTVRRHDGRGTSEVTEVRGTVTTEAVWSRANTTRVAEYRKRQNLPETEVVPFSAGSLVLTGPARLTFRSADDPARMLVPLRSTTAEHRVLANSAGRGDARWTCTTPYEVDVLKPGAPSPVWVTVTLAPGSGGRALELDVQWRFADPVNGVARREADPVGERIDELRLSVPGTWGEVENVHGAEDHSTTAVVDGWRDVVWERAKLEATDRGRCHLTVSFQRRILDHEEDSPPVVRGTLRATFKKALSGATGVQVHAAGGGRRRDGAATACVVRTKVELTLHLDLRGLRYQEVRTVPDPARDGAEPRQETWRFQGVAPNHETVARLTDLLSDQGYYVKAVVENPTQSGANGKRKRVWDVNGRRYNGVHPINFHIGLTGEEVDGGQRGAARKSSTTVRLNVWGTYATDDMEQDIVAEQAQLWDRIHAAVDPSGRVPVESVDTAAVAELDRMRQAAITVRREMQTAHQSGEPCEELLPRLVRLVDDEFGHPGGEA